jgi:hypothetical protein
MEAQSFAAKNLQAGVQALKPSFLLAQQLGAPSFQAVLLG